VLLASEVPRLTAVLLAACSMPMDPVLMDSVLMDPALMDPEPTCLELVRQASVRPGRSLGQADAVGWRLDRRPIR
jgi:hypothetical protein